VTTTVRAERDGPVLRVTLARPERRNALDPQLVAELTAAFADVADARAVVLAGDGPAFCAGADITAMRAFAELSRDENVADALRLRALLDAIDGCPAPVVARIHGHALGGGSALPACCDVALAAPDTVFGFSEVKLGIAPAVIAPFVVARIGRGAARRLFATGERFDAATALRVGLVHELADDLDAAVERTLGELLSAGPEAARVAKALAREPVTAEETAQIAADRRASAEGREGLSAFVEKRPPSWRAPG
jgi:methylglutaconyl-CoA hydratase